MCGTLPHILKKMKETHEGLLLEEESLLLLCTFDTEVVMLVIIHSPSVFSSCVVRMSGMALS
jgi:hypothetical protein